jgi:hypothetical protein
MTMHNKFTLRNRIFRILAYFPKQSSGQVLKVFLRFVQRLYLVQLHLLIYFKVVLSST